MPSRNSLYEWYVEPQHLAEIGRAAVDAIEAIRERHPEAVRYETKLRVMVDRYLRIKRGSEMQTRFDDD